MLSEDNNWILVSKKSRSPRTVPNKRVSNFRFEIRYNSLHMLFMGDVYDKNKIPFYKLNDKLEEMAIEYQKEYRKRRCDYNKLKLIINNLDSIMTKKEWINYFYSGDFCDNNARPLYLNNSETTIQANLYEHVSRKKN
jgi:hypothetical protein